MALTSHDFASNGLAPVEQRPKKVTFVQRLPDAPPMVPRGVGGQTVSALTPQEQVRSALIAALFAQLNASGTGALSSCELQPVASFLGFSGGETQWLLEFGSVCKYLGCNVSIGLAPGAFDRFLNDRSARGLFCTEAELRTMVRRFTRRDPQLEANGVIDYEKNFDGSFSEPDDFIDCDFWNALGVRKACAAIGEGPQLEGESGRASCQAFCARMPRPQNVLEPLNVRDSPSPPTLSL